jgi:acetoin utilization deacetylase AcuC-like enzyme
VKLHYTNHAALPLPEGRRFPVGKSTMLRETLQAQGDFAAADFIESEAVGDAELLRVHDPDYVFRVQAGELSAAEQRRIGFPWSPQMVERARRSTGATLAACRTALDEGCGANLGGGTHHAHRDFGSGFCVFNDVAVAARAMQAEGRAERIAVVDCDVHQGDGTAAIFAGDDTVFSFSIHAARNFPFRKQQGDLDVELADGCEDAEYLDALTFALPVVFERARPQLVIYLAGADPYAGDRLGRLKLSMAGLAERDRLVLQACADHGSSVAIAMAGGYAYDISEIIAIHVRTLELAKQCFP